MPQTLPLDFSQVTVNLPAVGQVVQNFNMGLIIGIATVISTGTRVQEFSSLADMLTAGFQLTDPEYLAAAQYFGAASNPSKVAIGRKNSGTETSVQAITACRAANANWYAAYDSSAVDADQAAVQAYVETLTAPYSVYFLQSSTSGIKSNTGGNLFATSKTSAYKRSHGLFSSSAHAAANILGYAMGKASFNANSNFTLKYKTLPGATPEVLTTTEVSNIEGNNGNIYVTRGQSTAMYEQGVQFSGDFFDQRLGLDMLSSDIQTNVINLLLQNDSIPQTEGGMSALRTVVGQACQRSVDRGFLAPGTWNGSNILTLVKGDPLGKGYVVMSDAISAQLQADRDARKAPNIYACVKLAGSVHSVAITVNVNR
jgi:hypothetical protein